jgi:peptidoglycan/xylan/chitin deacetylase (PgdA/CDA1 family)
MNKKIKLSILSCVLIATLIVPIWIFKPASATPKAYVSITFDDAWKTQYDYAYPILQAHNMKATFYIPTGMIGIWWSFITPAQRVYMSASEIQTLNSNGMEIASHTYDHKDLNTLSENDIRWELQRSKDDLAALGIDAVDFAYPDGSAYANSYTDNIVMQYYQSARGGNYLPLNYADYIMPIPAQSKSLKCVADVSDGSTQLAHYKQAVDVLTSQGGWMIINFHNVGAQGSWSYPLTSIADFNSFCDYLQTKGVVVVTVHEALAITGPQPTPTPTITPTPSPSSTPSVSPTPTPSPTPNRTLSPSEWAEYGKWVANGSSLDVFKSLVWG